MRLRSSIGIPVLLALALALAAVLLVSSDRGWGARLGRASFDLLQALQSSEVAESTNCPVLLVYLDVESHLSLHQDPAARWDRALHTQLLERLTAAGARAVVFDVVFDTPWPDPAVDQAFANAMRRHGRVILAAERHPGGQATGTIPGVDVWRLQAPTPVLREAAAGFGAAELDLDEDFVVRRLRRGFRDLNAPTLARATYELGGTPSTQRVRDDADRAGNEWMRYYGKAFSLPHVSYHSVLEPGAVDSSVFRDRAIFVGARPMAGVFRERRDELRHPLSWWTDRDRFMPGVEVQATQFLNWSRHESLHRISPLAEESILAGLAVLLVAASWRLRVAPGAALAAATVAATAMGAAVAWSQAGAWFAWLIVPAFLAPAAWGSAVLHHGIEWHRQRRRLEAQRREDQRKIERQAALIEKAQDLIVVMDLEGRMTYANPAGCRVLGWNPPATGVDDSRNGATIAMPDFNAKRDLVLSDGEWSGTVEQSGADGQLRIIESRWTLIRDQAGGPEAILMIGSDVTERRRLEAEFLRAQKWEAVGSLAGGMAHDLNNRLAPALLGLQWLQQAPVDAETRRLLAMIESHTRRGAETVRQVLQFLRGGGMAVTEIDPAELVRELESLVRETFPRSIRIVSLVAPQVGRIRGNATQLQQALLNLCLNARDAMPEGGQLTFAVDDIDLEASEAESLKGGRPGPYVLIAISDSGTGIPPGNLERIFDPLFTTKTAGQGTGLGLPSVLRVIEHHRGCLGVTSEVGAGSTFEVYLPRLFAFDPGAGPPTG